VTPDKLTSRGGVKKPLTDTLPPPFFFSRRRLSVILGAFLVVSPQVPPPPFAEPVPSFLRVVSPFPILLRFYSLFFSSDFPPTSGGLEFVCTKPLFMLALLCQNPSPFPPLVFPRLSLSSLFPCLSLWQYCGGSPSPTHQRPGRTCEPTRSLCAPPPPPFFPVSFLLSATGARRPGFVKIFLGRIFSVASANSIPPWSFFPDQRPKPHLPLLLTASSPRCVLTWVSTYSTIESCNRSPFRLLPFLPSN